ncbi:hypothetical protein THOM_2638 [Trachipleistophora hominis]|uniref:Uncharacterized protein n=1 Tax=Trachipleistophora hominis TaxID=72359 RepID=L7JSQ4_TRAHO|nr:hypothetical protein THOM_2638 [Trachipleistophora hominis]
MKNILQQMMEESYNDRRRAKSRFIRSVVILLVALITPFLFSMMLMLFRILVFDSNTFKIEDVSYNAAQDPQNIHVTAGFANRSPLHVKVSDISIDFYVSTESRKYLLLFSVKKDETILQKGKQIAVKDHLLKIVDIRNENTLCLLRAKKIKIALRYKLSLRIFGVYLGRHMTSAYIIDLENNGSKVKKAVEIWRISAANDAIEVDLRFIGYVMSNFFRIYIPRLTLEVKCGDYLLDVIVDPMSVDNGVVQENLRVMLKFHPKHQLCINDIIKKVIKTRADNRDYLQLAICSLKNDCGIFNRFFDKLDVPILTLLSNSAGKSGGREDYQDDSPDINVNYDLKDNAIFLKKVGRGSTIFQYLFGVLYTLTLNCTIEKEMVAKIVIQQHIKDHMLKAKVELINLQRIIAAILNNDTIYMRVNLPNPTPQNVFRNFFISYAVKDGFVFSFSEITEK